MPRPGKICLGPGKILVLVSYPVGSPPKEDATSHVQSIVQSQVSCGHETNIQVGLKDGICSWKRPQKRCQSVYFENYSWWVYAQVL